MRKLVLFALALLGLFDSLYLLWAYTSSSRPMVCVGGGCDVVRASAYAHFAGLPLPIFGAAMYVTLAALLFVQPLLSDPVSRAARGAVAGISAVGFLTSLGLTAIEAFVIHAWCAWCVVSAITVTLIFILAALEAMRVETDTEASRRLLAMQRNLAVLLGAIVLGVPTFVFLTRRNAIPPPKAASPVILQARLVRPDTHFYGNPDARLTVVEFGDFECPFCRQAEASAQELRQKFGDRIRFAFRQFPLTAIHPYAEKAAEASECAAQQGKFWQAVDYFYGHQSNLTVPALEKYAGRLGLDQAQFNQCLSSGEMAARVRQDLRDGRAVGVSRVPTFFIGHTMVEGALPYSRFQALVEQQLNENAPSARTAKKLAAPPAPKAPSAASKLSHPAAAAPFSQSSAEPFGGGSDAFTKIVASNAGCSVEEAREKQPMMIGVAEARRLSAQAKLALFVDVRSPGKFAAGHIPGAIDLPSDDFAAASKKLPQHKTIVLYQGGLASGDICAASRAAGRLLLSRGFGYQKVKVFKDGLAGWQKAGLPVQH